MIILASSSPRRQQLLEQIGLAFQVVPSSVEEINDLEPSSLEPTQLALKNARRKAKQVAKRFPAGLVIGADTLVAIGHQVLGKPKSEGEARRMLGLLSGREHQVITGLCVLDIGSGWERQHAEVTRVKFRRLSAREIEAYVATGEPLDKAGAYGIQGKGALLVEAVHGCFYNVVGLPLVALDQILRDFGINLLAPG